MMNFILIYCMDNTTSVTDSGKSNKSRMAGTVYGLDTP